MNNVNTPSLQVKPVEPIALLDCGQASKETKGVPYLVMFEMAPAPWDRALMY
jgi:hypothetical protein